MFNKQKKRKKKYGNSKLHFIVFLTSEKPINLSISKWFIYSGISVLLLAVSVISVFAYNTYTSNAKLNNNLCSLEKELQKLQVDNLKLGVENTNLKDSLDEKTVKVSDALSELENLQGSIKEIKEIVGLPVDEDEDTKDSAEASGDRAVPAVHTPALAAGSRSLTSLRDYSVKSLNQSGEEVDENFESIEKLIEDTREELQELLISAEDRKQYLEDVPTFFPAQGKISSLFGARWGTIHRGVDISNNIGTWIYAAGNGVVIESKYGYSYGNYVLIEHKNGFKTRYAHMSKRLVKVGDEVKQGELIGLMGNTGTSYGSHLHYEMYYYDKLIDPLKVDNYLKYKE